MRIQSKIVTGQLLVIVGVITMAVYAGYYQKQTLLNVTGNYSITIAEKYLQDINQQLFDRIDALRIYGQTSILQLKLDESNSGLHFEDNSFHEISLIEKNEIRQHTILISELSRHLRSRFIEFYDHRDDAPFLERVLVTNRYGKIIAQTHTVGNQHLWKDRNWWLELREKGYHLTYESSLSPGNDLNIHIAVRVDDRHGRFSGVISGTISLLSIVKSLKFFAKSNYSAEFHMFTENGKLLYGSAPDSPKEKLSKSFLFEKLSLKKESGYFLTQDGETPILVSYIPSKVVSTLYQKPEWYLVMTQDARKLVSKHAFLDWNMLQAVLMVTLLILGVTLFISTAITNPIRKACDAARKVAQGHMVKEISYQAKDEMGELTWTINTVLAKISNSYRQLQRESQMRQKIENDLSAKAQELERSNSDLRQFAYIASHDLQEPLRKVSSYMTLLEERYTDRLDEDAKTYIQYAVNGALRMKNMIEDLLRFSRVQTQKQEFTLMDVGGVIEAVIDDLELLITENHAVIHYDGLPSIVADAAQLHQLFRNLLTNAIKYHGKRPPKILISAQREQNSWSFAIKDNGIGIDPRFSERIFQIFQRLHRRDVYIGNGIGLAICKKIVERHGGHIFVESTPGQGSTFKFTIPDYEGIQTDVAH